MGNDRELLERAAKAAGLTIKDWRQTLHGVRPAVMPQPNVGRWIWDPLTDDGDALRLRLLDEHAAFTHELAVQMGAVDDPNAATRRAIVRAAAAIGEGRE